MKNPWIVVGLVAVVVFGGSIWFASHSAKVANEGIVEPEVHVKGNSEATVVLTEYSDFQCPACAQFQPVLKDIVNEFGDKLKFEYKHYPLPIHPLAIPAARAAEAAGQQGKFFEFHDALFENQAEWSNSANPMVNFMVYANDIGLDTAQFKRQYGSSILREKVRSEQLEGMNLNITGTPTFYLNGVKMEIKTFEDFYNQIAEAVGATTTVSVSEPKVEFGI